MPNDPMKPASGLPAVSRPDARLVKILPEELNGAYSSVARDENRPNGAMRAHAPAAHWSSTKLATGED
jgi:hypothetical protein